ncbi:hypothetical protein ACFX19_002766 [Malus domestica]|uniref:F-box domain-containing protein n=1 Tax=Malus domestica TaxID=3750 RepID=A0A498J0C5_MALDO|nr:hypothetical protein DVH24_037622 [Malus domestica]
MCHYCGAELTQSNEKTCKVCAEKQERESVKQGKAILYTVQMITPTTSLSGSDTSVSSCSEFSVDVSSCDRVNQEENTICSSKMDVSNQSNDRLQNSSIEHPVNGLDIVYTVNVEIIQTSDDHEAKDSNENEDSNYLEDDTNAGIWEPPEPHDPKADAEECGDGMKGEKPSPLGRSRDKGSGSYRFKEEKQRSMEALVNGKFKALISQLLRSAGVASYEEGGESWVEVIASLSWEAASLLKPDAIVAKARDLDGYVKVKCIATGVRSQSQLVKGLVFKKHAAHKLMPTKYENPRLLLIQGVLGQSSGGLSSFDSMELSKTLMFIEDSCTCLGCTALLKGAQSDALKIKSVVQCAVFLAYHLILETAFFVDQRATLSYADLATDLPTDTEAHTLGSINSGVPQNTDTSAENESDAVDILISNESHEGCSGSSTLEFKGNSTFDVPRNLALISGFSSISVALRKVMGEGYRTLWFQNVDRLSELPFDIVRHILSRLAPRDIACACTLSKTWHGWLTTLCHDIGSLRESEFRSLAEAKLSLSLEGPLVKCTVDCHKHTEPNRLNDLVDRILEGGVRILGISIAPYLGDFYELPARVGTSSSVQVMELVRMRVDLPAGCLKNLSVLLIDLSYASDPSMRSFFHNCPRLKVLHIEGQICEVPKEKQMININSISLMELRIRLHIQLDNRDAIGMRTSYAFKVAAPNLGLLDLDDTTCAAFGFQGSVMREARVQVGLFLEGLSRPLESDEDVLEQICEEEVEEVGSTVFGLSESPCLNSLILGDRTMGALGHIFVWDVLRYEPLWTDSDVDIARRYKRRFPVFPAVKSLTVQISHGYGWLLLPFLVTSFTMLEVLSIEKVVREHVSMSFDWRPPEEPTPACLLTSVREINLIGFQESKDEADRLMAYFKSILKFRRDQGFEIKLL